MNGVRALEHRVLIVDDEPSEQKALARVVGQLGYEVEAAASAETALELVEAFHPTVVITDLMLPGMDGLELLQQLKGLAQPPSVCSLPDTPPSRRPSKPCVAGPTTS